MVKMGRIEKAKANYIKAWRANVRLKHMLRADDEIRDGLSEVIRAFDNSVQQGVLPAPPRLVGMIDPDVVEADGE